MGMVEGGGGAGLAPEPLQALGIPGILLGQELEGDTAAEAGVLGLVDDPHTAASQWLERVVVRDGLTDGDGARMAIVSPFHPWFRLRSLQAKSLATLRAKDLHRCGAFVSLNRILAVWTGDVHKTGSAERPGDPPALSRRA
jgi:hypothetical protein